MEKLTFKQATEEDIDFVIESIIEADKAGSSVISMCNVFELTEQEYVEILKDVLKMDVEDYDFYLSGFLICKSGDEYVGAAGSWLEGAEGIASGTIKTSILFPYLEKEKTESIKNNLNTIKEISLKRDPGALQLEYVYVREKYRGCGIFYHLASRNILRNLSKYSFTKVQSVIMKNNYKSYSAFLKFGYKVADEKSTSNPEILKFFSFNARMLLQLEQENLNKLKN